MLDLAAAERDEAVAWTVTAIVRGSTPQVEIDDATGAVRAVRRLGPR